MPAALAAVKEPHARAGGREDAEHHQAERASDIAKHRLAGMSQKNPTPTNVTAHKPAATKFNFRNRCQFTALNPIANDEKLRTPYTKRKSK
jgi:hypothetical protein